MQSDQVQVPSQSETSEVESVNEVDQQNLQETVDRLRSELIQKDKDSKARSKEIELAFVDHLRVIEACVKKTTEITDLTIQKYQLQLEQKDAEIIELSESIRYKIGDKVVETVRNPLKVFLWPLWAIKALLLRIRRSSEQNSDKMT
jgi:hypothetical protein